MLKLYWLRFWRCMIDLWSQPKEGGCRELDIIRHNQKQPSSCLMPLVMLNQCSQWRQLWVPHQAESCSSSVSVAECVRVAYLQGILAALNKMCLWKGAWFLSDWPMMAEMAQKTSLKNYSGKKKKVNYNTMVPSWDPSGVELISCSTF